MGNYEIPSQLAISSEHGLNLGPECNTQGARVLGLQMKTIDGGGPCYPKAYHRNCTDNFWEAMVEVGCKPVELASPLNLWQNTPVEPDGTIKPNPPVTKKGDNIILRAEMDLVVCLSACPQDITSICGLKPRNAHFEIH